MSEEKNTDTHNPIPENPEQPESQNQQPPQAQPNPETPRAQPQQADATSQVQPQQAAPQPQPATPRAQPQQADATSQVQPQQATPQSQPQPTSPSAQPQQATQQAQSQPATEQKDEIQLAPTLSQSQQEPQQGQPQEAAQQQSQAAQTQMASPPSQPQQQQRPATQPPMAGQNMSGGSASGVADMSNARYAGFWIRFLAHIIDSIILFVIILVLSLVGVIGAMPGFEQVTSDAYQPDDVSIVDFIGMIVSLIYYVAMTGSSMQATLGKKIVGIQVIREDGSKITYLRSLGRCFAYVLSYITILIGFIIAGFTKQKTALHDMVAGTRVVYSSSIK